MAGFWDAVQPKLDIYGAIKGFEGYTPKASWDYKQHSIGYGTRAKYPGEVIDRNEAENRLRSEVDNARRIVDGFAPHAPEGVKAALTSLTFNAGSKWQGSGLGQAVKAGDWDTAQNRFLQYNKAGGSVLPGLVARRQAEATWFNSPMSLGGPAPAEAAAQPPAAPNQASAPRMSLGGPMPAPKQQPQGGAPDFFGDIAGRMQNPLFLGGLGMLVAANQGQDAASALNAGMRTGAGMQDQQMQMAERNREAMKQRAVEEFWNSYDGSQLPPEVAGMMPGLTPSQRSELVLQHATGQLPSREDAELKRRKLEAEVKRLESPTAGQQPKFVVVNGRLVRADAAGVSDVTPETATKAAVDPLSTFYGKEQARADFKTIGDYRTASDGAGELRGNLDALKKARSETDMEGPIMGLLPALTSSQQAVDSTAENVRLGFVAKTKGAVSDAEMRIFGMATPGRRMRDDAANTIIEGMDLAAQRTQEQAVFFDEWMRSNGNLNGAQAAWQKYTNSNPIIRETKPGQYVLNKDNVGNWRQFFSSQGAQGQPTQPPAPKTTQQATQPPPLAIQALRANARSPEVIKQFEEKYRVPASQFLGQ